MSFLSCVPLPHVALHFPHSPQLYEQSTGHGCVLHTSVFSDGPVQALPPFLPGYFVLVIFCVPVPHVTLHVPEGAHSLHEQSTGHGGPLHILVFIRSEGQAVPPFFA